MSRLVQNLLVIAIVLAAAGYLVRLGLRRRSNRGACANCAARAKTTPKRRVGSH